MITLFFMLFMGAGRKQEVRWLGQKKSLTHMPKQFSCEHALWAQKCRGVQNIRAIIMARSQRHDDDFLVYVPLRNFYKSECGTSI